MHINKDQLDHLIELVREYYRSFTCASLQSFFEYAAELYVATRVVPWMAIKGIVDNAVQINTQITNEQIYKMLEITGLIVER